MEDCPHRGFDRRTNRAHGGKVLPADETLRARLHPCQIKRIAVPVCPASEKRIGHFGRIHIIGIFFFGAVKPCIKRLRHLHSRGNRNIARQLRIERERQAQKRDGAVRLEVRNIAPGMHACVGASHTGYIGIAAQQLIHRFGQRLLNGRAVFLHLPAMVSRAVVRQNQCNIHRLHSHPSERDHRAEHRCGNCDGGVIDPGNFELFQPGAALVAAV